jgi:SNF2 family DNA or RNA helicase
MPFNTTVILNREWWWIVRGHFLLGSTRRKMTGFRGLSHVVRLLRKASSVRWEILAYIVLPATAEEAAEFSVSVGRDVSRVTFPFPLAEGISKIHCSFQSSALLRQVAVGKDPVELGLFIIDHKSKNRTFANGVPVPSGGRIRLGPGDCVTLGDKGFGAAPFLGEHRHLPLERGTYRPQTESLADFEFEYVGVWSTADMGTSRFMSAMGLFRAAEDCRFEDPLHRRPSTLRGPQIPMVTHLTAAALEGVSLPVLGDRAINSLVPRRREKLDPTEATLSASSLARLEQELASNPRGKLLVALYRGSVPGALLHACEDQLSHPPPAKARALADASYSTTRVGDDLALLKHMERESLNLLDDPKTAESGVYAGDVTASLTVAPLRPWGALSRRAVFKVGSTVTSSPNLGPAACHLRYPSQLQLLAMLAQSQDPRVGDDALVLSVQEERARFGVHEYPTGRHGFAVQSCGEATKVMVAGFGHPVQSAMPAPPRVPVDRPLLQTTKAIPPFMLRFTASPFDGPEVVSRCVLPSHYAMPFQCFQTPVHMLFQPQDDPDSTTYTASAASSFDKGQIVAFSLDEELFAGQVVPRLAVDLALEAQALALALRWWRAHKWGRRGVNHRGIPKSWLSVKQFLFEMRMAAPIPADAPETDSVDLGSIDVPWVDFPRQGEPGPIRPAISHSSTELFFPSRPVRHETPLVAGRKGETVFSLCPTSAPSLSRMHSTIGEAGSHWVLYPGLVEACRQVVVLLLHELWSTQEGVDMPAPVLAERVETGLAVEGATVEVVEEASMPAEILKFVREHGWFDQRDTLEYPLELGGCTDWTSLMQSTYLYSLLEQERPATPYGWHQPFSYSHETFTPHQSASVRVEETVKRAVGRSKRGRDAAAHADSSASKRGVGAGLIGEAAGAFLSELVPVAPINERGYPDQARIVLVPASKLRPGPIGLLPTDPRMCYSGVASCLARAAGLDERDPFARRAFALPPLATSPWYDTALHIMTRPVGGGWESSSSYNLQPYLASGLLRLDRWTFGGLCDLSNWTPQDFSALPLPFHRSVHTLLLCYNRDRRTIADQRVAAKRGEVFRSTHKITGLGRLGSTLLMKIVHMMAPCDIQQEPVTCLRDMHSGQSISDMVHRLQSFERRDIELKGQIAAGEAPDFSTLEMSSFRHLAGLTPEQASASLAARHRIKKGVHGISADVLRNHGPFELQAPFIPRALVARASLVVNPSVISWSARGASAFGVPGDEPLDSVDEAHEAGLEASKVLESSAGRLPRIVKSVRSSLCMGMADPRRWDPDEMYGEPPEDLEMIGAMDILAEVAMTAASLGGEETIGLGLLDLPDFARSSTTALPRQVAVQYGPYRGPWKRDSLATVVYKAGEGNDDVQARASLAAAAATMRRHRSESVGEPQASSSSSSSSSAAAAIAAVRMDKSGEVDGGGVGADESEEAAVSSGDKFDLFHTLEASRPPQTAPAKPTPRGMGDTVLLPYQQRALAWMCAVEDGEFGVQMGLQADPSFDAIQLPLWSPGARDLSCKAVTMFVPSTTKAVVVLRPPLARTPPRGGILADEMGLGKTLEVAALLLARPRVGCLASDIPWGMRKAVRRLLAGYSTQAAPPPPKPKEEDAGDRRRSGRRRTRAAPIEEPEIVKQLTKLGCPADRAKALFNGDLPEPDTLIAPIKSTLIVAPTPLLDQWEAELAEHAPGLSVCKYEGMEAGIGSRGKFSATSSEEIAEFDVILCSYDVLRNEERAHSARRPSPLLMVEWWRVVLDEAQMVSTSTSATSKMAASLGRVHAWCVSGTPMSNRVADLHGLLTFLAFVPFAHTSVLRAGVLTPFMSRRPTGLSRMRGLIQCIMWRHRKAHVASEIHLPPATVEDVWVELSPMERSFYEQQHLELCREVERVLQAALEKTGSVWALESVQASDAVEEPAASSSASKRRRKTAVRKAVAPAPGQEPSLYVPPKLMLDLLRLRQVCCHPRVVQSGGKRSGLGKATMRQTFEAMIEQRRDDWMNRQRDVVRAMLAIAECGSPGPSAPHGSEDHLGRKKITAHQRLTAAVSAMSLIQRGQAMDAAGNALPSLPAGLHLNSFIRLRSLEEVADAIRAAEAMPDGPESVYADAQRTVLVRPNEAKRRWDFDESLDVADVLAARVADLESTNNFKIWVRLELRAIDAALQARLHGAGEGMEPAGDGLREEMSRYPHSELLYDARSKDVPRAPQLAVHAALLCPVDDPARLTSMPVPELLARRSCLSTYIGEDTESQRERVGQRERHTRRVRELANARREEEEAAAAELAAQQEEARQLARQRNERRRMQVLQSTGKVLEEDTASPEDLVVESMLQAVTTAQAACDTAAADVSRLERQLRSASSSAETNDVCPVCNEFIERPAIAPCSHALCEECASALLSTASAAGRRPVCPMPECGKDFDPAALVTASARDEHPPVARAASLARSVTAAHSGLGPDTEALALQEAVRDLDALRSRFGSKVTELVLRLAAIRKAEPFAKAVVFSQWVKLLELVAEALSEVGVRVKRLTTGASDDSVGQFRSDPRTTVLLVSTKSGGGAAGLTLTMAHHLFLMEPSTNVGLEEQAMARVHRIGQRHPVIVHRLLAEGTVEKGILSVQALKKMAASSNANGTDERLTLFDVCRLFDLVPSQ